MNVSIAWGNRPGRPAHLFGLLSVLVLGWSSLADGAGFRELQAKRPDLFHAETGYRIGQQRAPIPDDIPPPAVRITADEAAALLAKGAIAIDVFGALQSRYDELDGTWLVGKQRLSLPNAVWLPETGRGVLTKTLATYLERNLANLTAGRRDRAIIVFCVADCWMSWNAAQRIARLGYRSVHWLAHGTDGWLDSGRPLKRVRPVPITLD